MACRAGRGLMRGRAARAASQRPIVTAGQFNACLERPGRQAHVSDTVIIAWRPLLDRLRSLLRAFPSPTWVHGGSRPQWVSTREVPAPVSLFELPVGAPAAAALMEIVAAAGARRAVCLGAAGGITGVCGPGTVLAASAAFGGDGTTAHYRKGARRRPVGPSAPLLDQLVAACGAEGLAARAAPVWTTDGWFRETPGQVAHWRGRGAWAVEMETAALYASAAETGVAAASLLLVTDTLATGVWRPGRQPEGLAAASAGMCRAVAGVCAGGQGPHSGRTVREARPERGARAAT